MKTYVSFFRMRFLTLIQYRTAAWAGIACQMMFGLMRVMVLMAFYASGSGKPGLRKACPARWRKI